MYKLGGTHSRNGRDYDKRRDGMTDFFKVIYWCSTEHKWRHLDGRKINSSNITGGHREVVIDARGL